jgi:S-adenosylmethionine decarboxylase
MKKLMFEGSEKKVEIIFSPMREPLRNLPESFWNKLCHKAQARIVSRFSNSFCNSYILSESSLFVWDHRLLMLTCGGSSLVNATLSLLKSFRESDIDFLFYQRKNEFFPYSQKSSFMDDFGKIKNRIKGKAYCFGAPDGHHFYLFHSEKEDNYFSKQADRTIEILMYDLDDHIKDIFFKASSASDIRSRLGLDQIFKNGEVDDYIFKPVGYSLNGLIGENQYYTIHVTPQEPGFYVSFETNATEQSANEITEKVLSIFKPFSFDVIVFRSNEVDNFEYKLDSFNRSAYFTRRLSCGYEVSFSSFFTPFKDSRPAYELF